MTAHHLLVGSGIAAISAAESIRHADPRARITMVSPEAGAFYSRPGLAYLLTDEVPETQLTIRSEAEVAALQLERIEARVTVLSPETHTATLHDGRRLTYDRVLLATGATSIPLDIPGATLPGVLQLDDLSEAREFVERAKGAKRAVIVGGGSTALELVEGLHARRIETHYLLRGSRYWSMVFDPVESAIVEARLTADGVILHRHCDIIEAVGRNGVLVGVNTSSLPHLACDLLAVAIGIRPRLELARAAGLTTDRGIVTNEFLESSATDVFAAGDAAQVYDPVTRRSQLDTLWASALQQGRTAGLNMAGVRVPHRKRPAMNVTRVAGITVTIVGSVGEHDDPDLLTLTRGQSERWIAEAESWTVSGAKFGDRLRVVVSGRAIVGAVVMGDQRVSKALAHLVGEAVDISELRPALDAAPEQAMDLLLAFCDAHVGDSAAHHH